MASISAMRVEAVALLVVMHKTYDAARQKNGKRAKINGLAADLASYRPLNSGHQAFLPLLWVFPLPLRQSALW